MKTINKYTIEYTVDKVTKRKIIYANSEEEALSMLKWTTPGNIKVISISVIKTSWS